MLQCALLAVSGKEICKAGAPGESSGGRGLAMSSEGLALPGARNRPQSWSDLKDTHMYYGGEGDKALPAPRNHHLLQPSHL